MDGHENSPWTATSLPRDGHDRSPGSVTVRRGASPPSRPWRRRGDQQTLAYLGSEGLELLAHFVGQQLSPPGWCTRGSPSRGSPGCCGDAICTHTRRQRCVSTSRHAVQGDERIFAGERRGRDAPSSRAHDAWTGSAVIWIGHRPLAAPVASRSRGVSPVQGGSNHPTCERWIGYGRSTRVASSPLPRTTFASDHAVGRSRPHLSRAARHRYPIAWIAQAELESACSGGKGSLPPHSIVRASRRAHSSSARSLKRSRAGSAPCAEERCDTARLRRPGVRRRGGRGPRRRCSRRCRGVCGRQNAVGAPQSARSDRSEHDGRRSAARCLPRVRAVGRSRRRPLAGHRRGTPCVAPAPCERAPRTRPPTTGTTT